MPLIFDAKYPDAKYRLTGNNSSLYVKKITERIMLTEITVKGGGTIPRRRHEAEQIILMQKGEARVTTGNEPPHLLKAGDIWVVPSNTLHGVEYLGDVEALEMVSPPRMDNFVGYTIKHTFFEEE
jgi:quercetin dioxygenase-like cupin family protein